MNLLNYSPIINEINFNEYKIGVLRLDLIDPEISGNKWFKLKYNLQQAITEQKKRNSHFWRSIFKSYCCYSKSLSNSEASFYWYYTRGRKF